METIKTITTKSSVRSMAAFNRDYNDKLISEVQITISGNYTNGHWLLKPEFVTEQLMKWIEITGGVNKTFSPEDTDLFDDDDYVNAEYSHSLKNEYEAVIAIFRNQKGIEVGFHEGYISWLMKNIKDFRLKTKETEKIGFIISGNKSSGLMILDDKVAGLIMPVRIY